MFLLDLDIVIIVMGQTGSAKSTFFNTLFNEEVVTVGTSLDRCTEEVTSKILHLGTDKLLVMDTPGLDDEDDKENVKIISKIAAELKDVGVPAKRRTGIIYLHDINTNRPRRQKELFQKLTDHNGWPLLIGITMWDASLYTEECIKSQGDALNKKEYFGDTLQLGAEVVQIRNKQPTSAWNAVKKIHEAIKKATAPVILLLGQTGSGKSTFISVAGGPQLERKPKIGYRLDPCTNCIEEFLLKDPQNLGQYVRLIDTPGFNSGTAGDLIQLKMIRDWLRKEPETELKGILFLDDEPKQRPSTAFVTTPSDIPRDPAGIWVITTKLNRRDKSYYSGANVMPFDESRQSAWKIIRDVEQAANPTITFGQLSKALDPTTKSNGMSLIDRILEWLGIKK